MSAWKKQVRLWAGWHGTAADFAVGEPSMIDCCSALPRALADIQWPVATFGGQYC